MGSEQIQLAKNKALLPAFQFNWSQIGVKRAEGPGSVRAPSVRVDFSASCSHSFLAYRHLSGTLSVAPHYHFSDDSVRKTSVGTSPQGRYYGEG